MLALVGFDDLGQFLFAHLQGRRHGSFEPLLRRGFFRCHCESTSLSRSALKGTYVATRAPFPRYVEEQVLRFNQRHGTDGPEARPRCAAELQDADWKGLRLRLATPPLTVRGALALLGFHDVGHLVPTDVHEG